MGNRSSDEPKRNRRLPERIGPHRLDLVEEFRQKPFGRHSPDLQALLDHMRGSPIHGKFFLLMVQPHERWALARFSREDPLEAELYGDEVFDDIEEAERYVFDLRWQFLFGESPKRGAK